MYPIHLTGGALFIDNSSLERFTTCPRSAQYYLCSRREAAEDRTALTFGKIIHKVLETYYKNLNRSIAEREALMLTTAAQEFQSWQPPEGDYRNYDIACQVIEAYCKSFPLEEFRILSLPEGGPAIEVPFAVPLGEIEVGAEIYVQEGEETPRLQHLDKLPLVWQGRIDLIYETQGRVSLMDHKTTSMMGPSYFKEFELSHQVYGYVWAASQLLKRAVYGFNVNALAIRKPTKTGKGIELVRQIVPLDQCLLDEWIDDTLHIVSDFVENVRRGYFPKHTKWCVGKYGECPYRSVCAIPPDQRELMLMSGVFKTVDWSPLK